MTRGKYIVIEGHDGTGKSTQVQLLRDALATKGIQSVEMHEPGGISLSDKLRDIIKDGSLPRDATTNLLLFTASRRELWRQLAEPALQRGEWVIAARNWYSTLAYQGYGEGLDPQLITRITKQFTSTQYMTPDFACILTLNNHIERQRRISEREASEQPDTFEEKGGDFQDKVNEAYLRIAREYSIPTVDASKSAREIHTNLYQLIYSSEPASSR